MTPKKRKISVIFFSFLVVFSTCWGIMLKPQPAQASWPVADFIARPSWATLEKTIFPVITDMIKSFAVRFVYEDLIGWISGEKGGKPAFITDFDGWLYEQADIAASQFLDGVLGDAYSLLCTGIDVNLALYWKTEFDEARYNIPKCRLSEIQRRFEDPGTEWVDFQISLQDANVESGYLFAAYEVAMEKEEDSSIQYITEALAGEGFVLKDELGSILTPGSMIAGEIDAASQALFDSGTASEAWTQDFLAPLIDKMVEASIKRGINEFNNFRNE